ASTQITTPAQLTPGLISMFSTVGNDAQHQLIEDNAGCLASAVLAGGLTQRSLHFIAGGAPIGFGSVDAYLPVTRDAVTWNSAAFSSKLTGCLQ
ncbi:MAG: hypothetical protein J2P17_06400, partial [Mycobacterium sp.]|nr:hypothetical protein [Mycobacterium sp.]